MGMIGRIISIFIPSGEKKELKGLETWQVQWMERLPYHGFDYTRGRLKGQLFMDKPSAQAFRDALFDAYKLVGDKVGPEYVQLSRVDVE